jgi:hypothetical protein
MAKKYQYYVTYFIEGDLCTTSSSVGSYMVFLPKQIETEKDIRALKRWMQREVIGKSYPAVHIISFYLLKIKGVKK